MVRSLRHILIATLICLHAAVTLGGAGLHALPGWGHHSGSSPLAKTDHSHGPGKSSHEATDDCPVCQFLTQGQLPTDLTGGSSSWLVCEDSVEFAPLTAPVSSLRLATPRAPPAISPI